MAVLCMLGAHQVCYPCRFCKLVTHSTGVNRSAPFDYSFSRHMAHNKYLTLNLSVCCVYDHEIHYYVMCSVLFYVDRPRGGAGWGGFRGR